MEDEEAVINDIGRKLVEKKAKEAARYVVPDNDSRVVMTIEELADELGCAKTVAAELIRKEALGFVNEVINEIVARETLPPPPPSRSGSRGRARSGRYPPHR